MQFNSKSAQQPLLEDVDGLVRFKGCYLLKSVKTCVSALDFRVRIAIFSDVENSGEISVRLLGDNYFELEALQNEYLQIEVAFKKVSRSSFYYLAWYETMSQGIISNIGKELQNLPIESIREDKELVERRLYQIKSHYLRDYCLDLYRVLFKEVSSLTWANVIKSLDQQSDVEVCIQLTMLMCKADIFKCGYFLHLLQDKNPYDAWEVRLLGC